MKAHLRLCICLCTSRTTHVPESRGCTLHTKFWLKFAGADLTFARGDAAAATVSGPLSGSAAWTSTYAPFSPSSCAPRRICDLPAAGFNANSQAATFRHLGRLPLDSVETACAPVARARAFAVPVAVAVSVAVVTAVAHWCNTRRTSAGLQAGCDRKSSPTQI